MGMWCRVSQAWALSAALSVAGRPSHFSLRAHARVRNAGEQRMLARRAKGRMPVVKKSNQKKGHPEGAPEKQARIHARPHRRAPVSLGSCMVLVGWSDCRLG